MGSTRRQRREEARMKEKELLRNERAKSKNNQSSFIKKKFLTYTLAGALALGGLEIGREQLPFLTGKKPQYDLTMVLLEHSGEDAARVLLNKIDEAKKEGKPYKIMFLEAANEASSTYRNDVIANNAFYSQINSTYQSLLNKGYNPQAAEETVEKGISGGPKFEAEGEDRFFRVLVTGLAIRGIRGIYIESRSDQAIAEDTKALNKGIEIEKEMHRVGTNMSLKDLAEFHNQNRAEQIRFTTHRNSEINAGLEDRFNDAINIFPELRLERLKGNQLRALAFIGFSHGPFLSLHKDISIRTEEYESPTKPITERIECAMSYPRTYDKRESYLVALEDRYISPVLRSGQILQAIPSMPGGKDISKRLADNALKLNLQQIEDLDKASYKIQDTRERWAFILNQVSGSNIFKKEMFN